MVDATIALKRLAQQRLLCNPLDTPEEVVAWLGAVQAQDYPGGKWALALRMQAATDAQIDQAFAVGTILRTHIMRPTWHFVTPADIRWIQELTASRVHAMNARMYRQLDLNAPLVSRSMDVIARALTGGRYLTRAELGSALVEAGILAEGPRLGYILHRAEVDALICSGPRRGKQFTYALVDERAPQARRLSHDEALAELTRRYFTGHGPATVQDFAWWSGLTVTDGKGGLEMAAAHLDHEVIDGRSYWFSAAMPAGSPPQPSPAAFLLPTFDEFLVGFASFDQSRRGGLPFIPGNTAFSAAVVIDGRVVGHWRRTFQKGSVVIELAPLAPLSEVESRAVADAANRFARFLGLPAVLQYR